MNFKIKDHFYEKAKKENFLARSVYKLEEIDKRFHIIKNGDAILDLGYSPGSWVQYCSKKVGREGNITGVDLKTISPSISQLKNVRLFEMDIFDLNNLDTLDITKPFDVLLSDMAANTTGIKSIDQAKSLNLIEAVFDLLPMFLKKGGHFVIKVFESSNAQHFLKERKRDFSDFRYLRPKSTRKSSKEFFVIAKDYLGSKNKN